MENSIVERINKELEEEGIINIRQFTSKELNNIAFKVESFLSSLEKQDLILTTDIYRANKEEIFKIFKKLLNDAEYQN